MPVPTIGVLTKAFSFSFDVRDTFGVSADADAVPTYAIYEHETTTAVVTGSMAKLGSVTGYYTEEVTLLVASGFESFHTYQLRISWTYNAKDYSKSYAFIVLGADTLAEAGGGSYPVSLADMKLHLKIETAETDDNTLISTLISAATTYCEEFQHRSYITQTRYQYYDAFPSFFSVPYPPLISVATIVYISTAGVETELDPGQYRVDTSNQPGRITEAYNCTWPATRDITNAVVLTYSAGYGAAADVPDTVKAAIKLLVAHWYEHREAVSDISGQTSAQVLPMAVESLLWLERTDIL